MEQTIVDSIIEHLGGSKGIRDIFGCSAAVIYNWRHRGIPTKYWAKIVKKGITYEQLAKATEQARKEKWVY